LRSKLSFRLGEAFAPRRETGPSNRSLSLALLTALALRLLWIVIATRTPTGMFNDAYEYLRMATGFSEGALPSIGPRASAFYAPGYPMLLAPFVFVARHTGWATPAQVASVVNLVAGTFTVGATAFLADRWISPRARNPAAWLLAVAPAHIYFTPTAHGETVFAALFLGLTSWFTVVADRSRAAGVPVRSRPLVGFGLLVALAVLVRGPGLLLLAVPPLVLSARGAPARALLRSGGIVLASTVVGLVPWTVVNGVRVGAWIPTSTQNATVLCTGHHDLADGGYPFDGVPPSMAEDCYRYSPFDDPELGLAPPSWTYRGVDEARWYRESSRRGIGYALTHPVDEVWLAGQKLVKSWSSEWDALPASRNYQEWDWAGRATGPLDLAAIGWLFLVEALAVAGLVVSPACRRAFPIWGSALLVCLTLVLALAQPHFRHVAVPFLVVLGAGAIAAVGRRPLPDQGVEDREGEVAGADPRDDLEGATVPAQPQRPVLAPGATAEAVHQGDGDRRRRAGVEPTVGAHQPGVVGLDRPELRVEGPRHDAHHRQRAGRRQLDAE
jgi:hypothetical protein